METLHVGDTRNTSLLKKLEKGHGLLVTALRAELQSTEVCNTTNKPQKPDMEVRVCLPCWVCLVSANFYLLTPFPNCAMDVFLFYSCPQLRVRRDFGLWTLATVGTVTILWTLEVEQNVFHIMSNTLELMRDKNNNKKLQFGCELSPKSSGTQHLASM